MGLAHYKSLWGAMFKNQKLRVESEDNERIQGIPQFNDVMV